jgi:hypothetical protein
MNPGINTITIVVQNWNWYSMSYGSSTGYGTDQTPYIIQVNSPMADTSALEVPAEGTTFTGNEIVNEPNGTPPGS